MKGFPFISFYHYYNSGDDYIDGLLAVKSNFAFEHNITLEVDFEQILNTAALIDPYDLICILSNIVDNAFDAVLMNKKQKNHFILCYNLGQNYCLSISNNGPPIPQEKLDLIFTNWIFLENR